ncbi:hypothetical protein [Peptacetobacter sp. AB845]|uniref:hypothetical protein n=1 Tax=Peptacetobacter sp. AB845 TaxID=3388429 RepID=UPI0039C99D9D
MNEEKIVLRNARKLKSAFRHLGDNEVVDIAYEIVKSNRKDNDEPDVEAIDKVVSNICGEQC